MKNIFLFIFLVFFLFFFINKIPVAYADLPEAMDYHETFVRAVVVKIVSQKTESVGNYRLSVQKLQVKVSEGQLKNHIISVEQASDAGLLSRTFSIGDMVVIDSKVDPNGKFSYSVYEPYRLDTLWIILCIFAIGVVFTAGRKGLGALIGMSISLGVIGLWIIPQILQGRDALESIIVGCMAILVVTTYIAHGISIKTTIAMISTALALCFSLVLSYMLMISLHTYGYGNQDIATLQLGLLHQINPQGLMLGTILLGTLGALNDITTTQAVTMFALVKENPKQNFSILFRKGMHIGKEHIASLINTLILAYAGSSFAVFLFFAVNSAHLPWWLILNNETTMEEILKMVVGSSALILVVPLTTALAVWIALKEKHH